MKSDSNDPKSIAAKARARRCQLFAHYASLCGVSDARVLDMGGTTDYWRMNIQYIPDGLIKSIYVLNLPPQNESDEMLRDITLHIYAGNALEKSSFRQNRYDIVYSNSLIEHVGNVRSQWEMANIVMETGTYYFIQTPAKSFPLEPHFYVPFFAYLPLLIRSFLYRKFRLGFMGKNSDWLEARITCDDTRFLSYREFKTIFRGCDIIKESLFGLCKSYMTTNMAIGIGKPP